ncbi:hypothetical protein Trco_003836 [Trichoderma cornu-damae]|uniref:Uncharacterized protein n=1 Tax=Trichoderma cornu-damae TaxID=654480 RepID=A0A9P8TWJ3_9HYPO|nr:hypothetical protein Trco_003836 [Trichoderma cornu-damae]
MTYITQPSNPTPPLVSGHHYTCPNPAPCAFDLSWGRKEAYSEESAVRSRAYPSPPMSGSPPLPLRSAQEAGSRGEAPNFYASSRLLDGLRGGPAQPSPTNLRGHASPISRSYPQEPATRSPYSYPRPEEQAIPSHTHPRNLRERPKAMLLLLAYLVKKLIFANLFYGAHTQSAMKPPAFMLQEDLLHVLAMGKRRPVSMFSTKKEGGHDYETKETLDSTQPDIHIPRMQFTGGHRVYIPRECSDSHHTKTLSGEANPTGLQIPNRSILPHPMEPVAYLSMDFDIVKASPMFMDIIHASSPIGNKLSDIITPHQASFLNNLQNQLFEEQRLHEPNYLPPILGRLDLAIKEFGFTSEDVAKFRLNHLEYFDFVGFDGYTRTFPLRFGLAKEGSFYFVVFLLNLRPHHPPPPPPPSQQQHPHYLQHLQQTQHVQHVQHAQYTQHSQHPREPSAAYHHPPNSHQPAYGDQASCSPADPYRHRLSEGAIRPPHNPITSNVSASSGVSSYTQPQPIGPSYQTSPSDHAPIRPSTQPSYQLPPIREQPNHRPSSLEANWSNGERPRRVDIGGLLEQPRDSGRR